MGTPINEREASWNVQGVTLTLLRAVTTAGYTVSVHQLGGSLLGRPGAIEMMPCEMAKFRTRRVWQRTSASLVKTKHTPRTCAV